MKAVYVAQTYVVSVDITGLIHFVLYYSSNTLRLGVNCFFARNQGLLSWFGWRSVKYRLEIEILV